MPKRRGGKREVTPAAAVIDAALAGLGVGPEWRVVSAWSEVAGPVIGARTVAERVVAGVLWVRVPSPAWAHELTFFRAQLTERLRARARFSLKDIRFVVGDVETAASAPNPPAPVPPAAPAPTPAAVATIEAASAAIPDPELARALRALGLRVVRP
ncbi:MAG TPA: DUF721 domain-containing protein [Polyangia bacterium]|nr:DUF721 domain-containing protein [Polyangia bacterium]